MNGTKTLCVLALVAAALIAVVSSQSEAPASINRGGSAGGSHFEIEVWDYGKLLMKETQVRGTFVIRENTIDFYIKDAKGRDVNYMAKGGCVLVREVRD